MQSHWPPAHLRIPASCTCSVSVWGMKGVCASRLISIQASLNMWLRPLAAAVNEGLLLDTRVVKLACWFWERPCKCMLLSWAAALLLCTWFILTVLIPAWPSCVCCSKSAYKPTLGPWAYSDECINRPVFTGEWGLEWLPFPSAPSLVSLRYPSYPRYPGKLKPYFTLSSFLRAWVSSPLMRLLPQNESAHQFSTRIGAPSCPWLDKYVLIRSLASFLLWTPGTGTGWIPGGLYGHKPWLSV